MVDLHHVVGFRAAVGGRQCVAVPARWPFGRVAGCPASVPPQQVTFRPVNETPRARRPTGPSVSPTEQKANAGSREGPGVSPQNHSSRFGTVDGGFVRRVKRAPLTDEGGCRKHRSCPEAMDRVGRATTGSTACRIPSTSSPRGNHERHPKPDDEGARRRRLPEPLHETDPLTGRSVGSGGQREGRCGVGMRTMSPARRLAGFVISGVICRTRS